MKRPPLAHRVIIPRPYVPALHSDIRRTIAAEKRRIAQQSTAKGDK